MVDTTAAAFGMQPATSRGRNVPRRREVDAQTEEAFAAEEPKGIGYAELLLDNIIGLDNQYESTGEAFGKAFNEDELGTLKNMAVSAYEGAKEFVTSPIETTGNVVKDIRDSVYRLGSEDLDARIRRMYGIGYQDATDEQVTKAREAVIGDAVTASSLIPAAKGIKSVSTVAADAMLKGYDPNVLNVFAGLTGYSNYTGKPMRGMADAYDTYAKNYARLRKEAQDNNTFVPEETLKYQASEDTWNQTGFFIGQDGDVRFEIDDSKATITPTKLTEINGYQYARDLIDRNKKTTTLQDFLKHDELFKAYPQLKDVPVFVDNSLAGTNTRGWFDPAKGKNSIALNPDIIGNDYVLNKLGMNTLLHEIQHYIQDIEGFDQGTNLTNPEIIKIYSAETKGIRGKKFRTST